MLKNLLLGTISLTQVHWRILNPGSLEDLEQSENHDPGCELQLLANLTHHHFL